MVLLPPRSTLTDPLFPVTTLFRSHRSTLITATTSPDRPTFSSSLPRAAYPRCCSCARPTPRCARAFPRRARSARSEEHTSELQSLMRISYAVFCLKKTNQPTRPVHNTCNQPTDNNYCYSQL